MDLAKLGVRVDPAGAVEGTRRVSQALREMGDSAKRETKKIDSGAKEAGQSVKKLGRDSRAGFLDLSRGLVDAADAAGLMNNGIGALIRRLDSAIRAGQQLTAIHRATAVSATASAAAETNLAAAIARVTTAEWSQAAAAGASGRSSVANAAALEGTAAAAGRAGVGIGGLVAIAAAALAAIAALAAGLWALHKALTLVGQGMSLAGPVQQAIQSFEIMTGSASEAKRVMTELRAMIAQNGGDLRGSMDTVKRFMALGFSPDNAIKLNRSILDVAGSIGMTGEEAKLLGAALAQVQAKGVVSMEELRQQIAEKGVPVFEELAKKLKVTTGQLIDMVSSGKVASKDLIDIFLNMEGGFKKFEGGAAKMTKTLPGAIQRLRSVWDEFLIRIGQPVNDAVTPIVNRLSDLIAKMLPVADRIGRALGDGIVAITKAFQTGQAAELFGLALQAAIETAMVAAVVLWQTTIATIVKMAASAAASAIEWIVGFFSGLLATVIEFWAKLLTGRFREAFAVVTNFFGSLFKGGGGVLANIGKEIYNAVGSAFERAVNAFYQGFMRVWQKVANLISAGLAKAGMEPLDPVAIPAPMKFFTPATVTWKDQIGAANDLVGTSARDALSQKIAALAWKPEAMGPPRPNEGKGTAENPEILLPKGTEGAGADKAIQHAEEVQTAMSRLLDEWGNVNGQIDKGLADMAQSLSSNLGTAIQSLIEGTASFKSAFASMASAVVSDIIRIITQMAIQLAIQRALGAFGYAGTAPFQISPPTYHTGGTPRPLSSEADVRVDRGETILTRRRASELSDELRKARMGSRQQPGTKSTATIINVLDRNEISDAVARSPGAVINAISRSLPTVRRMVTTGQRA